MVEGTTPLKRSETATRGDLGETHLSRDDPAVGIRKPERPMEVHGPGDPREYADRGDPRESHGNRDDSDFRPRTVGRRIGREVRIVDEIKLM